MPIAIVHTAFTLQRPDQTKVHYGVGKYDMPQADFDHNFTKLHIEGGTKAVTYIVADEVLEFPEPLETPVEQLVTSLEDPLPGPQILEGNPEQVDFQRIQPQLKLNPNRK